MSAETQHASDCRQGPDPPRPPRPKPLLIPAIALMLGIAVSEYTTASDFLRGSLLILPPLALAAIVVLMATRRGRPVIVVALVLLAAFGVGYTRHRSVTDLPSNHIARLLSDEPTLTRLRGRVVTSPVSSPAERRNPFAFQEPTPRTRFVVWVDEFMTTDPPAPARGYVRVIVKAGDPRVSLGDDVVLTGKLYRLRGPQNPGETDWAHFYRLQNIHAGMSLSGESHVVVESVSASSLRTAVSRLRAWARSTLFSPLSDDPDDPAVRLLDAMVLGHRSAAGQAINEAFLRTGGLHFLAVSGFHVGVLAGTVWWLTRRLLRRGRRTTAAVTIAVACAYLLITDANAPVLRAVTMTAVVCLAVLLGRPFCGINWLSLAAICILLYNPLELFRAGFQLSFVQVVALFAFVPRVYASFSDRKDPDEIPPDADTYAHLALRVLCRSLLGLVVVCICAWFVALPLVLYHFGRLAPWGAVQSIVISPLVVITIVLGFVALLGSAIFPPVGQVAAAPLSFATDLLLRTVNALASVPHTLVEVRPPPLALVALSYAIVLMCLLLTPRVNRPQKPPIPATIPSRRRSRLLWGSGGAVLVVAWSLWALIPVTREAGTAIHILSVGSGSAALVTTPDGESMLIDAGTIGNSDAGETVNQAANALGIGSLHSIAISHANYDHFSGVPTVLQKLPCGNMLLSPHFTSLAKDEGPVREFFELINDRLPPISEIQGGDRQVLSEATVEVLWPAAGLDRSWSANDRSLVLRLNAGGKMVMFPGDIERDALRALCNQHANGVIDLKTDVLVAPHHGSIVHGDTAAFLEAASPSVIVISTGLPRPEFLALVRETLGDGVRVFSTAECGAVSIHVNGDLIVHTVRN